MFEELSKSELEIMKVFWNENTPLSVNDIGRLLKNNKWGESTILTFLKRIMRKGLISQSKKINKISHYESVVSRQEYERHKAKKFLNENFQGSVKSFLSALTDDSIVLTSDDIKELDNMISKSGED